jgi:adenylate cyclase
VLLVVSGAAVLLHHPPRYVQEIENRSWDWRLALTADPAEANHSIKLILVDQASLDFFAKEYSLTWPIPRDAYKYVIEFLTRGHAKGLAFDMLFTESSAQSVEGDRQFAAAVGGTLPIVSALSLETYPKYLSPQKLELLRSRQNTLEAKSPFRTNYFSGNPEAVYQSATLPIPELLEQSPALGNVQLAPDSDGVFRHERAGGSIDGIPVLNLPFAFYHLVDGGKLPFSLSEFADAAGRLAVLPHGGSGTYEAHSLAAVIQAQAALADGKTPALSPETFRNAWVILGTSAPGLLDLRPTSLEARGNGVEFVAAVLDNIIARQFAKRPPAFWSIVMTALLVGAVTASTLFWSRSSRQLLLAPLIPALFITGSAAAAKSGYWIPLVLPVGAMLSAMLLALALQYRLEGRQRKYLRSAFQYYVSPELVEQIVVNPASLSLGGERRELSMFFSDIKGFTTISESLDPAQLLLLLQDYLTMFADIVQASGGTVDKYVGDAVVAFWNAPLNVPDHAARAVQCAVACQRRLLETRDAFQQRFGVSVFTRIGLNTGAVSVGNFGSRKRFNYTIVGDAANLASRLEGANKLFGTRILMAEPTFRALGGSIPCRRVADLRVVGKTKPVRVYEPFIDESQAAFVNGQRELYRSALEAFDSGALEEAQKLFTQLPNDPVSCAYLRAIQNGEFGSKADMGWSPVWNLSSK